MVLIHEIAGSTPAGGTKRICWSFGSRKFFFYLIVGGEVYPEQREGTPAGGTTSILDFFNN